MPRYYHVTAPISVADPEPGPERINALCDGVVSIALTVLALDIRLPEHPDGPLREVLAEQIRITVADPRIRLLALRLVEDVKGVLSAGRR